MSDPTAENDDYQALRDEIARQLRRGYEQADRWRQGNFTIVPREEPGDRQEDGFKPQMISTFMPISEELAMEYGLIPDTRPAPPPPTWRQRVRTRVRHKVNDVRWRLAAKIGGTSREAIEEITGLW